MNTWQTFIFAGGAALSLAASLPARADTVSGNDLFSGCTANNDPSQLNFCAGYIIGAVEGMKVGLAWPMMLAGDHKPIEEINKAVETLLQICAPPEVEYGQYVGVVVKYLGDHPENRHNSARMLIINALQRAFPCVEK